MQVADLASYFRPIALSLKPTRDALAAARKALADLQIPSTLVMKEKASFERPSYDVRVRGSFTSKGERVYAGTPSATCDVSDRASRFSSEKYVRPSVTMNPRSRVHARSTRG